MRIEGTQAMQEQIDILLKTIESLNGTIASLSEDHRKEVDALNQRIKELTAQVAWLNRQLFGRKAEKLPVYDPNYPDMFAGEFSSLQQQADEKRDEAVEQIVKETPETRKQKRQNRKMLEDLPVLEKVYIRPENLDESLYKKIDEEVTQIIEHKPGQLYIKHIIREKWGLKDNTVLPPAGMKSVLIADMPLLQYREDQAKTSLRFKFNHICIYEFLNLFLFS